MANQILSVPEALLSNNYIQGGNNLFLQVYPLVINTSGNVISGGYANQIQSHYNLILGPNNAIGAGSANGYGVSIGTNSGAISYSFMQGVSNLTRGNYMMEIGVHNHAASFNSNYMFSIGSNNEIWGNYNIICGNGMNLVNDDSANYNLIVGNAIDMHGSFTAVIGDSHILDNANSDYCVVGGQANTVRNTHNAVFGARHVITGSYNIIANGGATAPEGNTVSGSYNAVFGSGANITGSRNLVHAYDGTGNGVHLSSGGSFVMGRSIVETGNDLFAFIFGDSINSACGPVFAVGGNHEITVDAYDATVVGHGAYAMNDGAFLHAQDKQYEQLIFSISTSDNTPTLMESRQGVQDIKMRPNRAFGYEVIIVAKQANSLDSAMYKLTWLSILGNAGTDPTLSGLVQTVIYEDKPAWDATAYVDTTNHTLHIQVTGDASNQVNWTARIVKVDAY